MSKVFVYNSSGKIIRSFKSINSIKNVSNFNRYHEYLFKYEGLFISSSNFKIEDFKKHKKLLEVSSNYYLPKYQKPVTLISKNENAILKFKTYLDLLHFCKVLNKSLDHFIIKFNKL